MSDVVGNVRTHCPGCGADISLFSQEDIKKNKCPFCGKELQDLSRVIYDAKIDEVKSSKKKMMALPVIVAIIVAVTLVVAVIIFAVIKLSGVDYAISSSVVSMSADSYTSKLKRAYEKKDWDKMYDLVIENADKSISSPYYFTYRSAWMLSYFPPKFDKAYEEKDMEALEFAYENIYSDYHMRDDWLDGIYEKIPEIEDALKEEYDRETKLMEALKEE